jgi:hypothetical protein
MLEIVENSWCFCLLGLGYCNFGVLFMCFGMGYDSDEVCEYVVVIIVFMGG